ncbi:hypothetical protein DFH28DRAFT_1104374 [Melampsora americana]|nr:hypothetical protein DFH28DRAFT_1104374 [Melampsora americana]
MVTTTAVSFFLFFFFSFGVLRVVDGNQNQNSKNNQLNDYNCGRFFLPYKLRTQYFSLTWIQVRIGKESNGCEIIIVKAWMEVTWRVLVKLVKYGNKKKLSKISQKLQVSIMQECREMLLSTEDEKEII